MASFRFACKRRSYKAPQMAWHACTIVRIYRNLKDGSSTYRNDFGVVLPRMYT
jgi:hypothetical protein